MNNDWKNNYRIKITISPSDDVSITADRNNRNCSIVMKLRDQDHFFTKINVNSSYHHTSSIVQI